MTTSGTSGQTSITVAGLIEHIARRCKVMPNELTPESIQLVKNNIFMFLATLSNRGINMWRVQRALVGLYPGQAEYPLSAGTLDVLEALFRQPQQLAGTVTSSSGGTVSYATDRDTTTAITQGAPGGNIQWDFSAANTVNCVGLLANTTATHALAFEVSSDAVSWTSVKSIASTTMTDKQWYWYDIEPAQAARYFRIRETATGTINFREMFLSNQWTEVLMWRMNRDDYTALPQKRIPGRPLQFWFDRQRDAQKIVVWQVPSDTFTLISVYAHMHVEDVGTMQNTLDIPQRWYDAVVSNVAFACILDLPNADVTRYPILKDQASLAMIAAEAEERDASPTMWQPNLSAYNS